MHATIDMLFRFNIDNGKTVPLAALYDEPWPGCLSELSDEQFEQFTTDSMGKICYLSRIKAKHGARKTEWSTAASTARN